ncbi:MAG: DsbE family thiol:disulfide interchange protein [Pseudomonadota bacterium]
MARYLIPLAVFLALAFFFVVGLGKDPSRIPSPLLSKPLPTFTLGTVSDPNSRIESRVMTGKPALLNVWGSWCVSCAVEHEFLMSLAREDDLPIYGLNWKDELDDARQWLAQRGDPYVMSLYDYEGRAAIDLGVYAAPETFLLDANGTIVHKHIGPLDMTIWTQDFLPRLRQLGVSE